jgi:hypothetical protein
MRDPELVHRAERAATALEQALIHWRQRHGLDDEPLQPVTSYVGYSATEPWGQPRVVLGVHPEEAERLAAILEGHDCIGPVHAGISGWPARRQGEPIWTTVAGLPSRVSSPSPSGLPLADRSAGTTVAAVPVVPFIAPANNAAGPDLEPLPPEEFADVDTAPPSGGATAAQFAGPAATWSELADRGAAVGHGSADYGRAENFEPVAGYGAAANGGSAIDYGQAPNGGSAVGYGPAVAFEPAVGYSPSTYREPAVGYGPAADREPAVGYGPAADREPAVEYGPAADRDLAVGYGPPAGHEPAAGTVPAGERKAARAAPRKAAPPKTASARTASPKAASPKTASPKAAPPRTTLRKAVVGEASADNGQAAAPQAASARRRVVAPRPRTSPDDAQAPEQPADQSPPKWEASSAAKRTKPAEPAKDRPARTRLQPAVKSTRTRRTLQRPAAGTWPAVDGQPSTSDQSM